MVSGGRFGTTPWVVRARGSLLYPALAAVVAVPVTIGALAPATSRTPALIITAMTGLWLAWAYFRRPRLVVDRHRITVVNPWRTIVVPWTAVTDIGTRYFLTISTATGHYPAVAAPAPGGRRAFRPGRGADVLGPRPSDLITSESGEIAAVLRDHMRSRDPAEPADRADRADRADTAPVVSTPAVGVIAVSLVGVAASVIAWLWHWA